MHYTSERGVMGSVMKQAVLSRQQVENDPDVAFIFEGIWERKDPDWVDHISLSISRINLDLFQRSRSSFPDFWWAVMSFDVEILDHDGVFFTTTNNIHPPCRRGEGVVGFEAMFDEAIEWGYYGSSKWRSADCPDSWPTDRAAEVLYPLGSHWTTYGGSMYPASSIGAWSLRGPRPTVSMICRSRSTSSRSPRRVGERAWRRGGASADAVIIDPDAA